MLRAGLDTELRSPSRATLRKGGLSGGASPGPWLVSFHAAAAITCLALLAGCSKPPPVTVAVDLLCTETERYHTTDAQRAAVKADPATWYTLFKWLASFDAVRDRRCPS